MNALIPHLFTGSRLVLGTAALIAGVAGQLYFAATLISLGAVTDGLDGLAARRLGTETRFGAVFDYCADYVCFVIAPYALARALLAPGAPRPLEETVLTVPLFTGALRYARNLTLLTKDAERDLPGLGTVFFAFLCVAAVYLDGPSLAGRDIFAQVLLGAITLFSLLMLAPVRYPKITAFRGMSPAVLVLLALMPFVATRLLAGAMLLLGLLYAAVAPLFARRASRGYASAH
jgi:CDP-diacylglycerol--serine O-phosphatidyltransferase